MIFGFVKANQASHSVGSWVSFCPGHVVWSRIGAPRIWWKRRYAIRVVAQNPGHSALLACRFLPPRSRRVETTTPCRTVRPIHLDDAWTGLRAHSAAKDRYHSDFMRAGLSPAAISSAAALSGPTPWAGLSLAAQRRVGLGAQTADLDIEFRYLGIEGLVSAG